MEHLPYPTDAHYPRLPIPYLIKSHTTRYDGLGLPGFASRCGWQTSEADWYECEPQIAAERAQSWLYFGLLQEIFGNAFRESDFVRTDNAGTSFVDTSTALPSLLKSWSGTRTWRILKFVLKAALWRIAVLCSAGLVLSFMRAPWLQRHMRDGHDVSPNIAVALQEVELQIRRLEGYHADGLVCLSIKALLWSLRNAATNHNPDFMKRTYLELSSSRYLERILRQRGFCPHELQYITLRCSIAALHYISAYAYDATAHQSCSQDACVAFIVDRDQYVTKHIDSCSGCDFARVDLGKLKDTIESGHVPLICASGSPGNLHLEVKPLMSNTSYVAISHAWSGGLGNTHASSLPSCQLQRIVEVLRPLFPPQPTSRSDWIPLTVMQRTRASSTSHDNRNLICAFWMDTLCIPTRDEAVREIRYKALAHMNRIYAEAAHVVVLDETLRSEQKGPGLPFASSIFTSPWMTRCWTYLEGRLAQILLVSFKEGLQDPFWLYNRVATCAERFTFYAFQWDDRFQLERELAASMYKLRSLQDSSTELRQLENFVETWNEVLHRTTSVNSDVLIILAIMLGLSIYEVEESVAKERRLLALLTTQKLLPASLLFTGVLPDQEASPDCAWIPQRISSPVGLTPGYLERTKDNRTHQHYFRLSIRGGGTYTGKLTRGSMVGASSRLRLTSKDLPHLVLSVDLSSVDHQSVRIEGPLEYIIIVPRPTKAGFISGCLLRKVQEHYDWILLAFDRVIPCDAHYTIPWSDSVEGQTDPDESVEAQVLEAVGETKELRLDDDWSLWPSLHYQRSYENKPMASKQGPIHVYVQVLVLFEITLISGTIVAGILVCLDGGTRHYAAWIVAMIVFLIRLLVLFAIELPDINNKVKVIEYQRWVASFDHSSPVEAQDAVRMPLSKLYQYHSWPVASIVVVLSSALLSVGATIRRPVLYGLMILAAFLLCEIFIRILVEMIWRLPKFRVYRSRISKWSLDDFREGSPSLALLNPRNWFSITKMKSLANEPNFFTHSTQQLSDVFDDPMYFNEDYHRISDWYDPR